MQSQLEAALLGHTIASLANIEDDKDDEADDDDFIDEDYETEHFKHDKPINSPSLPKTVTLQMLLASNILQPEVGSMSIEYLGQKFVGDLLEDGKIRSQETDLVFASPSAWAIACKRFINPEKKSGCGWSSVRYKGKKLDAYKNIWYKRKQELEKQERDYNQALEEYREFEREFAEQAKTMSLAMQRMVVKHNTIANRTFTHDANTMIECVPFSNLGKIQPFLVSLSTNAALLMDFHCHLTKSEVSGYLAGQWDVNAHNLQITHAFPLRNTKSDRENAPQVEADIAKTIEKEKLTLVGWYHSHPFAPAAPTLRDVDAQLDYEIKMKGTNDNSYSPCIGIIISPYYYENASLESSIIAYWVIPPPEAKPNEYGRPMLMSYSVIQDMQLSPNLKEEIQKCADYYKQQPDFINFHEKYVANTTYLEKLKTTLSSKFPRDLDDTNLWNFIRELVGGREDNESVLSIPKPTQFGLNLLTPDIASVLFNSGKFPSASSLLGLPDPMAHSTLAANNMFLSSNLFKMQDLLRPLSASSPIPASQKLETKISTPLKIPTDIKGMKDYSDLSISMVGKDLSTETKSDFSAADLSVKTPKFDYSVSDLSVSSNNEGMLDLSRGDPGEKAPKIAKTDYNSAYDLSSNSAKSFVQSFANIPSDLSVTTTGENDVSETASESEKGLDLTSE